MHPVKGSRINLPNVQETNNIWQNESSLHTFLDTYPVSLNPKRPFSVLWHHGNSDSWRASSWFTWQRITSNAMKVLWAWSVHLTVYWLYLLIDIIHTYIQYICIFSYYKCSHLSTSSVKSIDSNILTRGISLGTTFGPFGPAEGWHFGQWLVVFTEPQSPCIPKRQSMFTKQEKHKFLNFCLNKYSRFVRTWKR